MVAIVSPMRYLLRMPPNTHKARQDGILLAPSEAARVLGVSTRTLIRWEAAELLIAVRTVGNHRRYRLSDLEAIRDRGAA